MIQPIFLDMLDDTEPRLFPSSQSRGSITPPGIYHGPYIAHDGFRPEGCFPPETSRGTCLTEEIFQLAQGVVDNVNSIAINGPMITEKNPALGDGTYMSSEAVGSAISLHHRWLENLRKPIPPQDLHFDEKP